MCVPLRRDPTITTVVTLLSAYSSYYVADRLVGASGLLAVVCNGFTMSLIGEPQGTLGAPGGVSVGGVDSIATTPVE